MSKLREPMIMGVIGRRGVGKTYTSTVKEVIPYLYIHKRKVLLFDVNDEYETIRPAENDKEGIDIFKKYRNGKPYPVKALALKDLKQWMAWTKGAEIRRIRPINTDDIHETKGNKQILVGKKNHPMTVDQILQSLTYVLQTFRNGLILMEDITTVFGGHVHKEVAGIITRNRHSDLDVIFHVQSTNRIANLLFENINYIRWHKQTDPVEKAADKVNNMEIFEIAEKVVNKQFINGNPRFYLYLDVNFEKLKGSQLTKNMVEDAIDEYIRENPKKILKAELNYMDDAGNKVFTMKDAFDKKKQELLLMYYGN